MAGTGLQQFEASLEILSEAALSALTQRLLSSGMPSAVAEALKDEKVTEAQALALDRMRGVIGAKPR